MTYERLRLIDVGYNDVINHISLRHRYRADANHWIGLTGPDFCGVCVDGLSNCDECRAEYEWVDNTPYLDAAGNIILNKWHNNFPDGSVGCVAMKTDASRWRLHSCGGSRHFVCKRGRCQR